MRTRVKICGITNLDDALRAIENGADALGFVFYPPSPRYVSAQDAAKIIAQCPPFVTTVGLFVNEDKAQIEQIIEQTQLDLIQFHGDETASFCQQFNRPYIKAIRMRAETDFKQCETEFASAQALLLDTYVKGVPGGTGETFNWDLIPSDSQTAIILAGGLNAGNVAAAIKTAKPYAVDVSGGVEASHGIKSAEKIKQFFQQVLSTE